MIFIVTHPLATGHPSSPVLYWLGWSFDPKNCKKHWKKIYDTYLAFSCLCPQCSQVVSGNQLNPPSIQEKRLCCRSLAAISHGFAFQHDVFHEIQTATVHYNAEIVETELSQIFRPWSFPQASETNPANSVKPEKMAVTNLSNLPRPTRARPGKWGLGTVQNRTRPGKT